MTELDPRPYRTSTWSRQQSLRPLQYGVFNPRPGYEQDESKYL